MSIPLDSLDAMQRCSDKQSINVQALKYPVKKEEYLWCKDIISIPY